jgi:hypothetical protein
VGLQSCEQVLFAGDLILTCMSLDKWSLTIQCHTPSCALYSERMKPAKPWPLPPSTALPSPLLPSFPLLPCTPPLPAPGLAQLVPASRSTSNALWREFSTLLNHCHLPLVFSSSHLPHFTLFFVSSSYQENVTAVAMCVFLSSKLTQNNRGF